MSKELATLEIISLSDLFLHEEPDPLVPNEDSAISLSSWNHLVSGQPVDLLFSCIKKAPQNRIELLARNRKQISKNEP